MPPKSKAAPKPTKAAAAAPQQQQPVPDPAPQTANERSWRAYWLTNPLDKKLRQPPSTTAAAPSPSASPSPSPSSLTPADRQARAHLDLLARPRHGHAAYSASAAAAATETTIDRLLPRKQHKDFWRCLGDAPLLPLPARRLPTAPDASPFRWGRDRRTARDQGDLPLLEHDSRCAARRRLRDLEIDSAAFRRRRRRLHHPQHHQNATATADAIEAERRRRAEMAALRQDLYGEKMDPYAGDPEWDDVTPIPQVEPEGALAAIAYPEEYAESMSYLRAIMAAGEKSPRALRLTENIIAMNPAHYTVWLYRFAVVAALGAPFSDELAWLNDVSLEHLKNYQIWHHRQLLLDRHVGSETSPTDGSEQQQQDLVTLARSERAFLAQMLAQDAKNYHVWTYRQYLVRKLGIWESEPSAALTPDQPWLPDEGDSELADMDAMIAEDVRNNSAWSHRFFLVFSHPAREGGGSDKGGNAGPPSLPARVVDRELAYARAAIARAPQNQSPWNYVRGVLSRARRPLAGVRDLAEAYAPGFSSSSAGEGEAEVRSSHALDLLADILAEAGDAPAADRCLARLADRWDPVRKGYWEYRRRTLGVSS